MSSSFTKLSNVGKRWQASLQKRFSGLSHATRVMTAGLLTMLLLVLAGYAFTIRPPADFPVGSVVHIADGSSLSEVLHALEESAVIRSPFALRLFVGLSRGEEHVRAGDYFFSAPRNVFEIARRILAGDFGITPVRVTIPEGATRADIANLFVQRKAFEHFSADEFLAVTEGKEGYLFPDTYFFLPTIDAPEVARTLEATFFERIVGIEDELNTSGHSLAEVVVMASLLEKEGRGLSMRRDIASVLWNRLAIGMPLQVDAVFLAINGKNTFDLTLEDLAIDSPYNTYRNKGLPPGPIANPGLDSLRAAATPAESDYLFYLSDHGGETHFARNFTEHKANKRRYLD